VIKHFVSYSCGSYLLMRWLSLFLTCQDFDSKPNLLECEDQSYSDRSRIKERELALPNPTSLRPGLLWLTKNLALNIQCLTLMISSAADAYGLWPTLRSLLSAFRNRGFERIGFITTLYQVRKLLSVRLSSVRICVPEESNHHRPSVEGASDYSIVQ
jgi:hypothetical protein